MRGTWFCAGNAQCLRIDQSLLTDLQRPEPARERLARPGSGVQESAFCGEHGLPNFALKRECLLPPLAEPVVDSAL